ncbi:MAG: thioredoxin domain-containing protein [Myxococcales bacterium]|nr:thioredoxin domain-containing protein [Myxococcales bacterium]
MTEPRVSRSWVAMTLTLASVGIALALYLVNVKLRLEFDPSFQSSCNFGSKLNCDLVQTSAQSLAFGFPLALWGAVTYGAVLLLGIAALRPGRHGRAIVGLLAAGGIVVCLHSVYLAYLSSFVIGAYCVYCMGMYGVNLALTGLAIAQWRSSSSAEKPDFRVAGGMAALAIGLMVAVAIPSYGSVRQSWADARIAAAKAQVAHQLGAGTDTATPAKAAAAGTAKAANAGAQGAASAAGSAATASANTAPARRQAGPGPNTRLTIRTHPRGFRYSDEIMRKGRSYFEVPVTAGDFPLGPANAPVTIVEFADFECGYCRALTANMKPLKKKYAGKVRWVFKHFPLDNRCNKVMKGTQHPDACIAAKAANCAGYQGKFWPMHDRIYDRKLRINAPNLRRWAVEVGVDGAKYDACFKDDSLAHTKTRADSRDGRFARIAGTPRTFINGHLVPGVNATEVLDYYIAAALKKAEASPKQGAAAAKGASKPAAKTAHGMVEQHTAKGTFWIDAFEASIDAKGRALSQKDVRPAEASWFEAQSACKKAGKRLCTEEEWVSACTGAPAVDNDGDKDFSDDAVEGSLFPYGFFHEGGRCNDDRRGSGPAVATGSKANCRSPAGVFDQSGNLAEWTGTSEATGVLSGTDFRWGPKATCMKRQERFGLGYRNATTGFRCCADKAVAPPKKADAIAHHTHGAEGNIAPKFQVMSAAGKPMTERVLRGHVTIVSFFASWCGPCRRELPDLNTFYAEHKAKGLKVLAIGVDKRPQAAKDFVASLKLNFDVAYDAKAVSMGAFGVKGMPTAFLVGRDGKILRRLVGINAGKVSVFKAAALAALKAKK